MTYFQDKCPQCGREFTNHEDGRRYCNVGCEITAGQEYRDGKLLIEIKEKLLTVVKDFGITVMDPTRDEEDKCFVLSFRGPEHRTLEIRTGTEPEYFVTWLKDGHLLSQSGNLGLNLDDIEKTFNWLLTGKIEK
jgi:hypothetical protein